MKKAILLSVIWFLPSLAVSDTRADPQKVYEEIMDDFIREVEKRPPQPPKGGYVSDKKTALAIGEAVAKAIFGEKKIDSQKPLRAWDKSDFWIVNGTLPANALGGTAMVKIRKKDGAIIFVIHGQ